MGRGRLHLCIGGYDGTDKATFRYSISGNSWAELADWPGGTVNPGAGVELVGDYIYSLQARARPGTHGQPPRPQTPTPTGKRCGCSLGGTDLSSTLKWYTAGSQVIAAGWASPRGGGASSHWAGGARQAAVSMAPGDSFPWPSSGGGLPPVFGGLYCPLSKYKGFAEACGLFAFSVGSRR